VWIWLFSSSYFAWTLVVFLIVTAALRWNTIKINEKYTEIKLNDLINQLDALEIKNHHQENVIAKYENSIKDNNTT
jgi:hypothetical protein